MKFLVSYKIAKQNTRTDDVVENINSIILDTKSTSDSATSNIKRYDNVVDENVLMDWANYICKKERVDCNSTYIILKYSILSFCKLGTY